MGEDVPLVPAHPRLRLATAGPVADRRRDIGVPGLVLAALTGLWWSHELEYLRAGATAGLAGTTGRAVHTYLTPLGATLAVIAAGGGWALWRLDRRLRAQLARLRHGPETACPTPAARGARVRMGLVPMVALLAVFQIGLYVVQENLEALAAHSTLPGVAAITGRHVLALGVHVGVAGVLAAVVWLCRRHVDALTEQLAAAWQAAWSPVATSPLPRTSVAWWWAPTQRWGGSLWSRPPPSVVI